MTESTNTPNPTNPSQPTQPPKKPPTVPPVDQNTAARTASQWMKFFADEIWSLHLPDPTDDTSTYRDDTIYVTTKLLAERARLDEALVLVMLHRHQARRTGEVVDILITNSPYEAGSTHNLEESTPYPYPQAAWLDGQERQKRIKAAKAADAAKAAPSETS